MGFRTEGEIYIPKEEFYEFVMGFIASNGAEVLFGPVKEDEFDIVIPVIMNTECHPIEEAGSDDDPEWFKEAKRRKGKL